MKRPPMVMSLPLACVEHEHALLYHLAEDTKLTRHQIRELHAMFAMKEDERQFVVELLAHKPHYWVFRGNQQRFCGDFVVVDMSSPLLEKRRVFVIDLKQHVDLKIGGGGAGNQFVNAAKAVRFIAKKTGQIPQETNFEKLVGDKDELLVYFGMDVPEPDDEWENASPNQVAELSTKS